LCDGQQAQPSFVLTCLETFLSPLHLHRGPFARHFGL
jgi:hypothetical protein